MVDDNQRMRGVAPRMLQMRKGPPTPTTHAHTHTHLCTARCPASTPPDTTYDGVATQFFETLSPTDMCTRIQPPTPHAFQLGKPCPKLSPPLANAGAGQWRPLSISGRIPRGFPRSSCVLAIVGAHTQGHTPSTPGEGRRFPETATHRNCINPGMRA